MKPGPNRGGLSYQEGHHIFGDTFTRGQRPTPNSWNNSRHNRLGHENDPNRHNDRNIGDNGRSGLRLRWAPTPGEERIFHDDHGQGDAPNPRSSATYTSSEHRTGQQGQRQPLGPHDREVDEIRDYGPDAMLERMEEDPDFVFKREGTDYVDHVINDPDAPRYKNQGSTEIKRKKDALKAIMTALKDNKFGGGVEEDWNKHQDEYETVTLDYQLRSKDMAFYLRLTIKDQALAVHRSEYPLKVKTYPKICRLLQLRFDTRTKGDTNSKVLHRLKFDTLLKAANGSPLQAFSALVLRVEKLASIAEPEDQTDKSKISFLMRAIEQTSWYIQATAGVENIRTFSEVVQRVNHELAKKAHNDPTFDAGKPNKNEGNYREKSADNGIRVGVLYGSDDEENNNQRNEATTNSHEAGNKADVKKLVEELTSVLFEGQRRYGNPPTKQGDRSPHRRTSREDYHRHAQNSTLHHEARGSADDEKDRKQTSNRTGFDQRCFNCGSVDCRIRKCKEPKDQARIEKNLQAWRKARNIRRPMREINLADIDETPYVLAEAMSAEIYL